MAHSTFSVAKRIAVKSDWTLSNLAIQKILYIAHMFVLGRYEKPLISGSFEAWDYGPVHPGLYRYLRVFGASPVEGYFHKYKIFDKEPTVTLVDEVIKTLGDAPPGKLVAVTHCDYGAWAKNYRPGAIGIRIPNEDILEEYRERERRYS